MELKVSADQKLILYEIMVFVEEKDLLIHNMIENHKELSTELCEKIEKLSEEKKQSAENIVKLNDDVGKLIRANDDLTKEVDNIKKKKENSEYAYEIVVLKKNLEKKELDKENLKKDVEILEDHVISVTCEKKMMRQNDMSRCKQS